MKNRDRRPKARLGVTVRPYSAIDFEFVRHLFSEYTEDEKNRLAERGFTYSWDFDDRYLRSLPRRTRNGGVFLVATIGTRRVGCVAAIRKGKKENWSWDATNLASGLVMELHIAPEFRGKGLGRQLMRAVENHFRSKGSDWLSLGVFATNEEARSFYERVGYQSVYVFMGKRLRPT